MRDQGYSWRNARHSSSYILPKSEHFGRWIVSAILMGVIFHVLLYLALEKVPVLIEQFEKMTKDKNDRPAEISMVDSPPTKPIETPLPEQIAEPPEETLEISEQEAELEDIMDEAIITPEIDTNLLDVKFEAPAMKGEEISDVIDPIKGPELEIDNPLVGRNEDLLTQPTESELVIDVGEASADLFDPDEFTKELLKKGAAGQSKDGLLEDFTSLENMKQMDGNALANAKALIGSDLLFEFGKADLKGSARNSLMAVAFLIDKHPEMYCVLEGHTDTYGSEDDNDELSLKRAEAVKHWLVKSLLLDAKRIVVRPYGERYPLVDGDKDNQAINRRVVIMMRNEIPPVEAPAVQVKPGEREEIPPVQILEEVPAAVVEEEIPAAVTEEIPIQEEPEEEIPRAVPE